MVKVMNKKIDFKASYETNSYVFVGEKINLNFICNYDIEWSSLDNNIATVKNGEVLGVCKGNTKIKVNVMNNNFEYLFNICVLSGDESDIVKEIVKCHNSNLLVKRDFDGLKAYNVNITESVNKILFNYKYEVNDHFLKRGNTKWESSEFNEYLRSVEFITVHYTGNFNKGANGKPHADYFTNENQPTSIHYITGNDGIYLTLDNDKRAAHAGDSAGPEFEWVDTGVEYDGVSLHDVKVSASKDFYYLINGKKSIIKLPQPYDYKNRQTDHEFLENGLIYNKATCEEKEVEYYFNKMGFRFIIKDNKYFMSKTWWCYTQTLDGRICNVGGNRNSIGIESCVDEGSDLWYTWQITAKLVANLMIKNNLDILRVVGHHFFTAKHCPAPMMVNDMELWYKFIELVKAEYHLLSNFNNYEITINNIDNNEVLQNNGRVNSTEEGLAINYEVVTINKNTNEEERVILSSIVL